MKSLFLHSIGKMFALPLASGAALGVASPVLPTVSEIQSALKQQEKIWLTKKEIYIPRFQPLPESSAFVIRPELDPTFPEEQITDAAKILNVTYRIDLQDEVKGPTEAEKRDWANSLLQAQLETAQKLKAGAEQPVVHLPKKPKPEIIVNNSTTGTQKLDCVSLKGISFLYSNSDVTLQKKGALCAAEVLHLSSEGWLKVRGLQENSPQEQVGLKNQTFVFFKPASRGSETSVPVLGPDHLKVLAQEKGVSLIPGLGHIIVATSDGQELRNENGKIPTFPVVFQGQSYSIAFNLPPGPQWIEVAQTKGPLFTTVMIPVLENIATYFQLNDLQMSPLAFRIIKDKQSDSQEVKALEVFESGTGRLLGYTDQAGRFNARNHVRMKRYPYFIEVSSKSLEGHRYRYRYEIPDTMKTTEHHLPQVSDRQWNRWLKQIPFGLNRDSGMVIGQFAKQRLNGFVEDHWALWQPIQTLSDTRAETASVLINGQISFEDPLEGDYPRFLSLQVPEGLNQINLISEKNQLKLRKLIPVSSGVVHVIMDTYDGKDSRDDNDSQSI